MNARSRSLNALTAQLKQLPDSEVQAQLEAATEAGDTLAAAIVEAEIEFRMSSWA